ncbi:hypothetical protein BJX61DRAFT_344831 [Aspergillus egyptiacus]|nr:hypothetical protein BJX61DRAFT_344831 [Aspergillus egyptiacus]
MPPPTQPANTKFTVLVRLPFPRGDFVDPPPVEWDAAKDQALWDILSRPSSKTNDIDWKALAGSFDVTLQFLLQQAAWLYDRQLSQVRAQVRKVGNTHSNTVSPAPGSIYSSTALGQPAKNIQGSARMPSRLSSQPKETPQLRAPLPRRTSSGNTVQQIRGVREGLHPENPTSEVKEQPLEGRARPLSVDKREQPPAAPAVEKSPTFEEEDLISSSSESNSDDESDSVMRRRGLGFKRFGRFSIHRPGLQEDDVDDDDSPAFLPFSRESARASHGTSGHDLSATLRMEQEETTAPQQRLPELPRVLRNSSTANSTASSVSSGAPVTISNTRHMQISRPSPRRAADMAHMSPRRSTASGRDISDGTPSMGSSFSDLDDTSVTESMLQDALLSGMQHGGMASRMSTISQAFRSRYLPG